MTFGSRTRRTVPGLVVVLISIALAGCQSVPFTRLSPSPNRPASALAVASRATLLPATVALDNPSEMSSIEPTGAGTGVVEPSPNLFDPSKFPLVAGQDAPASPSHDPAVERSKANPPGELVKFPELPSLATPPNLPETPKSPESVVATTPPEPVKKEEARPRPEEPVRAEDAWQDGLRKLVALSRTRVDLPGSTPSAWNLRTRVLAWLADLDLEPDLGQHDADPVRAVLKALDDPSTESPNRGDEVRTAVQVLEDKAPLELVELKLCSKVERYGDFETFEPPVRKAGQTVVIYCELDGVHHDPTSAGYRTRLAGQVEIVPQGGGPSLMARPLGTADETCRRRRRDYFIAYKLVLPKNLPPGDYTLRLSERDLNSDRSASREVSFAISKD